MTEHVQQARLGIEAVQDWQEDEGATDASMLSSAIIANAEATLALVAAQDRANELKRIEILALLVGGDFELEKAAGNALHGDSLGFAPSIAASLGLGGESDGE